MRIRLGLLTALTATCAALGASAADFKTLRRLNAAPPTIVAPFDGKLQPVEFSRIVVHPADGEPWGLAYYSSAIGTFDERSPNVHLMTWDSGASERDVTAFGRVFDDELKKAGVQPFSRENLFDDGAGSAALKIGVLVDDLQGRFCMDCPNPMSPTGIPATVFMTAHWEVYSSLDRKVVAKIATSGGADYKSRLQDSVMPVVFEAFRENVRQLLASDDFRRAVLLAGSESTAARPPAGALTPITFSRPTTSVPRSQASNSVAIVYAADGQGSGFLVSADGYVLTNQHVVGGSKYVKLKWASGAETLGEVVRADRRRDVALIKTDAQGRTPLSLRTGAVQQGETVFAIGTPLDVSLQNTMTKGIVSAERVESGLRYIQSDAGINHGNSGGPLLDDKGTVVAIAVSGLLPDSHQMGLNFFIPIDDALKALALTPVAATAPTKSVPPVAAKPLKRKG